MAEVYIVNASPIILLGKIERLDILVWLGARIWVPRTVVEEVEAGTDGTPILSELRKHERVEIVQEVNVPASIARWELGAGESQVLSLAAGTPATEVVIDDLAARKCARTLGCHMIGTIGAVLVGKKRGHIPAVKPVLTALLESGLRLSESLVHVVLAAAEES